MSKGRLTRHELSWLLTQEAQHAAERLRVGVQVLRTQAPPSEGEVREDSVDPVRGVETSLDALDDVMKMLSNLNQSKSPQSAAAAPRRGRIDVAALLVEVAPDARVSIEPGSGTEIYGEEADLRRMLQILVGHGSGEGVSANVRRDGDEVKVSVVLGPDASPTAETERAWLSRMALRYGGRHELEGGNEVLTFAAEGAQSEREALRKELDEARKQGEVYARELAAVFDRGEQATTSTAPPPVEPSVDRFAAVTKLSAGISSELSATLGPIVRELAALRKESVTDAALDTLRRRATHASSVVASLKSFGDLHHDELPTEVDLVEAARAAARECAPIADRDGVAVNVRVQPEGARVYVRRGSKIIHLLARELVSHAIAASPRGSAIEVQVFAPDASRAGATGARLVVDDAGSPLPASGRRAFLALETHAGAYGRPSGLPIFMAAELAVCQGAMLELSDAPVTGQADGKDAAGGGLRVAVTFAT